MSKVSLYFKRSIDNGKSFEPAIRINPTFGYNVLDPAIGISGNKIYLSWVYVNGDHSDIYLSISNDGGKKFSTAKNLSSNEGNSVAPVLSVQENNVYLAWLDDSSRGYSNYDVFFVRSSDDGKSFSAPVAIGSAGARASGVSLVGTDNNYVFLSWIETPSNVIKSGGPQMSEILFKSSSDGGNTFGVPILLTDSPGLPSSLMMTSSVSTNNSDVFVLWKDVSDSGDQILFRKSLDGAAHFDNIIQVGGFLAQTLVMAATESPHDQVYIAWDTCDEAGDDDITQSEQPVDEFVCNIYVGEVMRDQSAATTARVTHDGKSTQPVLYSSAEDVTLLWTGTNTNPSEKDDLTLITYSKTGMIWNVTIPSIDIVEKPALARCGSSFCMAWLDGLDVKFGTVGASRSDNAS